MHNSPIHLFPRPGLEPDRQPYREIHCAKPYRAGPAPEERLDFTEKCDSRDRKVKWQTRGIASQMDAFTIIIIQNWQLAFKSPHVTGKDNLIRQAPKHAQDFVHLCRLGVHLLPLDVDLRLQHLHLLLLDVHLALLVQKDKLRVEDGLAGPELLQPGHRVYSSQRGFPSSAGKLDGGTDGR